MRSIDVTSGMLELYITTTHDCPYLEGRYAANLLVDPAFTMTPRLYNNLLNKGFRRSGNDVYRPCCHQCQACVSTRILANQFKANRSQKRNWKRNADLHIHINNDGYQDNYSDLYLRYIRSRHAGGGMDNDLPETFEQFVMAAWCDTALLEFWDGETLLAVAATDCIANGLSSVYTFFDPEEGGKRGLGTYALLWQIDWAKQQGLDYVYPGYWIEQCSKMSYKTQFEPIEGLVNNQWILL